ncbi:hypothetical protein [Actinoplanes sp. NPDC049265]|uniref:hypothetical protein n=1 Tax=Actinoplanes sp. NPDC049265 TaxID=3363902 RepID=UPI0037115BD7
MDDGGNLTIVPVRHGDRTIGAYVPGPDDRVTYVPAVDVSRIAMAALGAATAMAVALSAAVALRRRPVVGAISMGPGGWVSLKRTGVPPLHDATPRPWWAHVLRAHRLGALGPVRTGPPALCRSGRGGRR